MNQQNRDELSKKVEETPVNEEFWLMSEKERVAWRKGCKAQLDKAIPAIRKDTLREVLDLISYVKAGRPEPETASEPPYDPTYIMIDVKKWNKLFNKLPQEIKE